MEDGDTTWIDSNYLAKDQFYAMQRFAEDGSKMTDNFGEPSISAASWQFTYRLCGQTFMYALDQKEKNNLTSDLRGSFVSESMIENQAVLEDLEIQTFTNIITGQSPVDEFDSFVEQWNALGGEMITREINEWHESMSGR